MFLHIDQVKYFLEEKNVSPHLYIILSCHLIESHMDHELLSGRTGS